MDSMIKIECVTCGGRCFVVVNDVNLQLPGDIKLGEAFPHACPLCENGRFAVLAEED